MFISYRRQDAAGHAGRLADGLISLLGRQRVFVDIDSIDPGQDFVAAIREAVNRSEVLLVVIGPGWLTAAADDGIRRLDRSDDLVRLEIESALRAGIRVVPILVHGASMPSEGALPASLRALGRCNAVILHDTQWGRDLDHLVAKLSAPPDQPRPVVTPRAGEQAIAPPQRKVAAPPALLNRTIGRDAELAALSRLVLSGEARLVTVTGPGGVGKTRLVSELGHHLIEAYRDGVAFVPLADAQAADDVGPIMCVALGYAVFDDGPLTTLESQLHDRQMLIVCDNFEHVIEATTILLALLAAAPGVTMLVTSRQRLGVQGEHLFRLDPLPSVAADGELSPAVSLFVARARAADPDFHPTTADLSAIAEICAACDGLPLAVELAAARTGLFTVTELREGITHLLHMPDAGAHYGSGRHRTLRASIRWSVDGLDPTLQHFLERLCVFRGGFTTTAAAAITDTSPAQAANQLDALLARSLVYRRGTAGGRHRFDLLETVREYLSEQTNADDLHQTQQRHAESLRDMMGAPAHWLCDTVAGWAAQLPERPNIRAAIRWARQAGDAVLVADLVVAAAPMWHRLGPPRELDEWLQHVIADECTPRQGLVLALGQRSLQLDTTGDHESGRRLLTQAEEIVASDDTVGRAFVRLALAWRALTHYEQEDYVGLVEHAKHAVELVGNSVSMRRHLLGCTALAADLTGDYPGALRAIEAELQLCRDHNLSRTTNALNDACEIVLAHGDASRALAWANEGIALAKELEELEGFANLVSQRGMARLLTGDAAGAIADLTTFLELCEQEGYVEGGFDALPRLAASWAANDEPRTAAVLWAVFRAATSDPSWAHLARQPFVLMLEQQYLAGLPDRLLSEYQPASREGHDLFRANSGKEVLTAVMTMLTAHDAVREDT